MDTAIPLTTAEVVDLAKSVTPPTDGIISRTIYQDSSVKVVQFGFGQGQELSEHTASMPAIMHFLSGEAAVTLGDRDLTATAGTWVHMALVVGLLLLTGSFGLFEWALWKGLSDDQARTVAVNLFVFAAAAFLWNCRSLQQSSFSLGWMSNPWIWVGIGLTIAIQLAFTYPRP